MKFRSLLIFGPIVFFLWVLAHAVLAQEETPPPYAGLKNPFPWSDASAREAGKKLYQQSCLGCHGISGSNLAGANFSQTSFAQKLEEKPGFYFWVLSEGRLDRGMPPFKSSLSEEQRWQILTYLRSLSAPVNSPTPKPPAKPPAEGVTGRLLLTTPGQAQSGQPLKLTATLQDSRGKPVGNALVKFSLKVNFFTSGLMEIGEAVTNEQGVVVLEYTPRLTGEIQIVAHYETMETTATLTLAASGEPFYQPEAGLHFPSFGQETFVFPPSTLEPEEGAGPRTVLRIPGGLRPFPLLLYMSAVILVWSLYLYVMYQGFRIPIVTDIRNTNTRLLPTIGLAVMVAFVLLLVWILATGPYSNIHLPW